MKIVIGIDEVGRGPLAGPVCVCAFELRITDDELKIEKGQLKLKDSKKLSQKQREAWMTIIETWQKEGKCDFAVSYTEAEEIDRIGLSQAIKNTLSSSLLKLADPEVDPLILLDGGLYAPEIFKNQKTIIKGDEKEPAISFASIVAKVHRDQLMAEYAKQYPEYGFESHVGYGTKAHYAAIKKHGLTPLHRRSFLKNLVK